MTELILRECMEKSQAKSSLAKPEIDNNVKIELSKEHLKELRNNAYSGTEEEDVVDHIAKVLEISNLIKTPNIDTNRLHVYVFPFSLTGVAQTWWIIEGSNKITTWSEGTKLNLLELVLKSKIIKIALVRLIYDPKSFEFADPRSP
ncbi:hypothetical protein Tco_0808797 [Tanacetum coccineum]